MASKQVTLVVCAVLFTAINLLVLAANWSIAAHAKVGGMDYSALEVDADFRRAIRDVLSQMDQSYWWRKPSFSEQQLWSLQWLVHQRLIWSPQSTGKQPQPSAASAGVHGTAGLCSPALYSTASLRRAGSYL